MAAAADPAGPELEALRLSGGAFFGAIAAMLEPPAAASRESNFADVTFEGQVTTELPYYLSKTLARFVKTSHNIKHHHTHDNDTHDNGMGRQKAAFSPTVPSPTASTRPRRPSQLNRSLKQPTVSSRSWSSRRRPMRGLELQLHARMQCRLPGACRCAACLARRHQHHQQAVHPRRRCRMLRWWRGCTHGTPRSLPLTKMRLRSPPTLLLHLEVLQWRSKAAAGAISDQKTSCIWTKPPPRNLTRLSCAPLPTARKACDARPRSDCTALGRLHWIEAEEVPQPPARVP